MAEKINLPVSYGGLLRYDEETSKIKLKPAHVIAAIVLFIILELILTAVLR